LNLLQIASIETEYKSGQWYCINIASSVTCGCERWEIVRRAKSACHLMSKTPFSVRKTGSCYLLSDCCWLAQLMRRTGRDDGRVIDLCMGSFSNLKPTFVSCRMLLIRRISLQEGTRAEDTARAEDTDLSEEI
jgi:hypothetical protein